MESERARVCCLKRSWCSRQLCLLCPSRCEASPSDGSAFPLYRLQHNWSLWDRAQFNRANIHFPSPGPFTHPIETESCGGSEDTSACMLHDVPGTLYWFFRVRIDIWLLNYKLQVCKLSERESSPENVRLFSLMMFQYLYDWFDWTQNGVSQGVHGTQ